jgi:Trypsin-like peptidase domain
MVKWLLAGAHVLAGSLALAQGPDPDPFVKTIDTLKRAVAPIACVQTEAGTRRPGRIAGTAFFLTPEGEFMTAAHVMSDVIRGGLTGGPSGCASPVVYLPATEWPMGSGDFTARWYGFDSNRCVLDATLDLALCSTRQSPSADLGRTIGTVTFDATPHADGTPIAFTGFPLNAILPMTARGHVAMYVARDELIVDQSAWPGVSGCPVYVADGRVIGMLIQRGVGEGTGRAIVRATVAIQEFVAKARKSRQEK